MTATPARFVPLRTAEQAVPFRAMTYPAYVPYLDGLGTDPDTVALGAFAADSKEPLALGLARADAAVGQILSLFVVAPARRQAIGGNLLGQLEVSLARCGTPAAFLTYPGGRESSVAIERMLVRLGWSPPVAQFRIFHATRRSFASIHGAAWFRPTRLTPDYTLFSWREVTDAERETIAGWLEAGIVPAPVSPFQDADRLDSDVSVGVRYRGAVYGWMVCHRIAAHTVRYTALFVHPDIPTPGLGLRLAVEAALRQEAHAGADTDFEVTWGCIEGNRVIALSERSLRPFMTDLSITTTNESRKVLARPE